LLGKTPLKAQNDNTFLLPPPLATPMLGHHLRF